MKTLSFTVECKGNECIWTLNVRIVNNYSIDYNLKKILQDLQKINSSAIIYPETFSYDKATGELKLITRPIPEGFVPLKNIVPLKSEDEIKTIMLALIEVVGELHKHNLIFGNLHPDYIFIKGSQIVLAMPLVEFTIRKTLLDKKILPFSPFYHYEQYSLLGGIKPIYDLYSLSAVLYYLIEGKFPEKEKQHSPNSIFPPLSRFTKFNELIKETTSKSFFHKIKTLEDYKKTFEEIIAQVDNTPEPNNRTQADIQEKTPEISVSGKEQLEKFIKQKKVKPKKVEHRKIEKSKSGKSFTVIKLGTKKVVREKTSNKPQKRGRKFAMIIVWIIILLIVGSYYIFKYAGFYYDKLPTTAITSIKYYNGLEGVKEIKNVIQLGKNKRAILFKDAENLDRLIVETDNVTLIDTVFPTNIYVVGIAKLSDEELIYYGYNEFDKTKWQGLCEILNIKNKRLSTIDMPFFYTTTGIAHDDSSGLLYIVGNKYTNIIEDKAYFPQYSAVSVFDINNFEFVKDTLIDTTNYFSFVKLIGKVNNNLILYRQTAATENAYENNQFEYKLLQYNPETLETISRYSVYYDDYILLDTCLIDMNYYEKRSPDYLVVTPKWFTRGTIYPAYFSKLLDKKASIKYEDINEKGNILVGNIKKDYASKNKARGIITISTGRYPEIYNYNTKHFLLKSPKAKLYFIKEAGNKIYLYGIENKDDEDVPFRIILNKKVLYRLAFYKNTT